jgi:hypothetical protein
MDITYRNDFVPNGTPRAQVGNCISIKSGQKGSRIIVRVAPFRSVDTPVANSPRDATANEPPRSTARQS